MKWVQAGSFLIQPTNQNIPVVEILSSEGTPDKAVLIYNDNQDHALLFRNERNGVILDYLSADSLKLLQNSDQAAVCEFNAQTEKVEHFYTVSVQNVKENFDVQLLKRKVMT